MSRDWSPFGSLFMFAAQVCSLNARNGSSWMHTSYNRHILLFFRRKTHLVWCMCSKESARQGAKPHDMYLNKTLPCLHTNFKFKWMSRIPTTTQRRKTLLPVVLFGGRLTSYFSCRGAPLTKRKQSPKANDKLKQPDSSVVHLSRFRRLEDW